MSFTQRDIVIVNFPFTDITGSKKRPALIVSNSKVNSSGDYTIVMLTSQAINGDLCEKITNADVNPNFKGLTEMNVYCKKIAVLNKSVISHKITECVNIEKFKLIIKKIESCFALE